MEKWSMKETIYLLLAILGISSTWYYNLQFAGTIEDPNFSKFFYQFIDLAAPTLPAKSINADLAVCLLTFFAWFIPEAIRLKMKHWWIFIVLTFTIAFAFAFPLFLFFRERKMRALKKM